MTSFNRLSRKFIVLSIYIFLSLLWFIAKETIESVDWVFGTVLLFTLYLLLEYNQKCYKCSVKSIQEIENRFRLLYKNTPYSSLDGNGKILSVNKKWSEVLGYEKDEVMGEWFGELLSSQHQKLLDETPQHLQSLVFLIATEICKRTDRLFLISIGREDGKNIDKFCYNTFNIN